MTTEPRSLFEFRPPSGLDIGKEGDPYVVEPLEDPIAPPVETPTKEREPEEVPA